MNFKTILLYSGLFSGLGIFSFFLLVNYTGLPDRIAEALYSTGACLFFIAIFNVLGYFTLRVSSWLNIQYALNVKSRTKIIFIYALVMLAFLLLNYGLLVTAKLLIWLVELAILGLLLANRSMQATLRLQQQAADLQKENNTARYTALQNQLNPHFLFNSLNTLIAEIEYDPANAVHFTKNLSNVYRYVLQCQEKPLITLGEELEFMKAYLFLHKVRLGDCIHCDTDIPQDELDRLLPPLTLQLLIENVIKHNSITPGKPMSIRIGLEGDYLVVSNPIHPRKSTTSEGVGLRNLANRCKLLTGKEIGISEKYGVFTVKIPLSYE